MDKISIKNMYDNDLIILANNTIYYNKNNNKLKLILINYKY